MASIRRIIPVTPILDADGSFVSLKNYADKPIKPNPFEMADPGRSEYGKEYKLSYSFSSKIEIAAIGGIEADMGSLSFVHDSIVYRLSRHPAEGGSDLVKGTWWGYGLRLKIVVRNAQLGVQAKWLGVAAAAQLGYLDAEFEIESVGISDPALFGLLPSPTDLNITTYREILAVGDKIRALAHQADPAGVIYKPLRIEVEVPDEQSIDPIADDRAFIFAYQSVRERTKLSQAKQQAIGRNISPDLVTQFYKNEFDIVDAEEKPSRTQRDKAEAWLRQ